MVVIILLVTLLTLTCQITADSPNNNAQHWCTAQGCSICEGHDCNVTCKGFNCGTCPSGSCCDGKNCNVCYNSLCCSTPSCNFCINTCRDICAQETGCVGICTQQCQNDINEVFVIVPTKPTSKLQKLPVYIRGVPYKGQIVAGQIPPNRKFITVNVDGTEKPATILNVPIIINDPTENLTKGNYNQNCCYVLQQPECYKTMYYPYQHCFRRTRWECSSICKSNAPALTQMTQQPCYYTNTYPYIQCRPQIQQRCNSCYTCNGRYNPYFCMQQKPCTTSCPYIFGRQQFNNIQQVPRQLQFGANYRSYG